MFLTVIENISISHNFKMKMKGLFIINYFQRENQIFKETMQNFLKSKPCLIFSDFYNYEIGDHIAYRY